MLIIHKTSAQFNNIIISLLIFAARHKYSDKILLTDLIANSKINI